MTSQNGADQERKMIMVWLLRFDQLAADQVEL
jgi:hypothetical protein